MIDDRLVPPYTRILEQYIIQVEDCDHLITVYEVIHQQYTILHYLSSKLEQLTDEQLSKYN